MRPPPESLPLQPRAPLESSTVQSKSEIELSPEEAHARLRARHEEFDELVVKPFSPMLRAIARTLVNSDKVMDLVQDTLVNAWKHNVVARCSRSPRRIRAYMKKTIYNCATDEYRSEGRRREGDADYAASLPPSGESEGPFEDAVQCDIDRFIEYTLQTLSRRCREVFEKVHREGTPKPEAAKALQMSLGTLKVHLRTINRALRRELGAVGYYSPSATPGQEKEDTP